MLADDDNIVLTVPFQVTN